MMSKLFRVNAEERLTAAEVLDEPFFEGYAEKLKAKPREMEEIQDHLRTTSRSGPSDSDVPE